MSRHAWLTPDEQSGAVCRSFVVPLPLLPSFMGALNLLTQEWEWEPFGDMTPAECATAAAGIIDAVTEGCMIGAVIPYAGATLPNFALACDGAVYNRVDYPTLYAILDAAFIVDADTFRTPNLTDRVVVGAGTVGETGGASTVTLTVAQLPPHAHADAGHGHADAGHTHGEGIAVPAVINGGLEAPAPASIPAASITAIGWANIQAGTAAIQDTGGGEAHDNMPPYQKLKYIIIAR